MKHFKGTILKGTILTCMKNLHRIKIMIHTQLTFSKQINMNSIYNPKSFYFSP